MENEIKPIEESPKSRSTLEGFSKLAQNIPAFTVVLVLFGFFNIYSYYLSFGIDITSYVEPSEILFSFSSLFFNATLIICTAAVYTVGDLINDKLNQWKPNAKTLFKFLFGSIYFLFISFCTNLVYKIFPNSLETNTVLDSVRIFILLFVIIVASRWKSRPFSKYVFIVSVSLLILLQRNSQIHSLIVDDKQPFYQVELKFADSNLTTDSTLLYVGSSSNYIFFWNVVKNSASVYPLKELKQIDIRRANYKKKEEKLK